MKYLVNIHRAYWELKHQRRKLKKMSHSQNVEPRIAKVEDQIFAICRGESCSCAK